MGCNPFAVCCRKLEGVRDETNMAMTKELEYNAKQKATDKLIKELLKAREAVREEVREVLHNAKLVQVEEEFREFHRRRAAQLAEMEANLERQRKEQADREEKEAEDNRIWRIKFYSEQSQLYKAEAEASSPSKVRKRRYEDQLDRIKDEFDDREQARIRMQVEAPRRSGKVGLDEDLGIYAVEHKAREEED